MRTIKTTSLLLGLFIMTLACTNENEQRTEELKSEIKAIGIERDKKTEQFAKNSERIVEELALMQRLINIDANADVSESETIISNLKEKNKKLQSELDEIQKKSDAILLEFDELKTK